jgi:hypothetical protein
VRSNPHETSNRSTGPSPLNVLAFVARVLEASVVVFTRVRFGERYLAGHALLAMPAMFLVVGAQANQNSDDLFVFMSVWALAYLCARADVQKRRRRGDMEHSQYNGFPILAKLRPFRRLGERQVKLALEPIVIFLFSAFVCEWNEAIGGFMMWGAAGTMVTSAMSQAQERQRLTDLRDTQIEQRNLAERFRENRW